MCLVFTSGSYRFSNLILPLCIYFHDRKNYVKFHDFPQETLINSGVLTENNNIVFVYNCAMDFKNLGRRIRVTRKVHDHPLIFSFTF